MYNVPDLCDGAFPQAKVSVEPEFESNRADKIECSDVAYPVRTCVVETSSRSSSPSESSLGEDVGSHDFDSERPPLAAQELYTLEWNGGMKDMIIRPVGHEWPWENLIPTRSTSLDNCLISVANLTSFCITGQNDSLAKISKIRAVGDGRYLVLLAWCYTRQDMQKEFPSRPNFVDSHWPSNAQYKYMLSSNWTITM